MKSPSFIYTLLLLLILGLASGDFSNYRVHGDGGIVARDYDKPNLFNFGLGMSYSF